MTTNEGVSAQGRARPPGTVPSWAITAVAAATAMAGAVAAVLAALHDRSNLFPHRSTFVVLTVLLAYTHIRPVRLVRRHGNVEADHMDEAVFIPMALMLGSFEVAVAVLLASAVGNICARRQPVKTIFNVGQTVLTFLAGYIIAQTGHTSPHTVTTILAAFGGGVVMAFGSSCAVAGIVRLAAGHPFVPHLVDQWRVRWLPTSSALLLGIVSALAVKVDAIAALPALGLALSMQNAYSAIVIQRQARLAAEALQNTVVAIRSSTDPDEIQETVRAAAPDVLHARTAEFVPVGTRRARYSLQVPIDDETLLQVSGRIGGSVVWHDSERSALSTLATVCSGALRNARLLAHLSAITDSQSEGVLALDAAGAVTFANPAARRLARCDDLVGQVATEVFGLVGGDGFPIDLTALAASCRGLRDSDATLVAADSARVPVALTTTVLPEPQTGVVLVVHDITERKAFEEKLTYLAFHDPLTYLPNRRLFEDRLDHALLRAERHSSRHALLMIDLDRFKLVNDSYGHPTGDSLLVQVAGLLRRSLRREDTCARLGGDEFAVLLEDIDGVQQAVEVAERILGALADGCIVNGHEVFVGASIGIATSDQAGVRDDLIAAADTAAYAAKTAGKGRYVVFAPDAATSPRARLELETSLRRALEKGEFLLHYQPLVDTTTGEPVAAEALVRWNSAEGLVAPYRFIPLAEETGLIVPLGAWVLEEACRQAQEWTLGHPDLPPLEISVNLSAHQLARPTIVTEIDAVLQRVGLRPEQLCLEITETVIMRDAEAAITTLRQLKQLGVQVAIDDFGTGYSSLSYLKQFPVDVVKVDRLFLAGLGENPVDSEIVAAVVRLATACGITAVAEGVETEDQRARLDELGCPLIQGFLISKPLPADDFAAYWTDHAPRLVPTPRVSP